MMQLHEEMPDGYLLTFQRELFTFLDLLYTKFSCRRVRLRTTR